MRVCLLSSEVVPFSKTGGLADVSGALPLALAKLGADVRVITPGYGSIDRKRFDLETVTPVSVPVGGRAVAGSVLQSHLPGSTVPVSFVAQPGYFDRPGLYGGEGRDYPDNLERFTFFCRAALASLDGQGWRPDVLHLNDWQTSLVPVYVKTGGALPGTATLLTIHNLAYQGLFPAEQFQATGLPRELFAPTGLEFWGQVNLLKGGLVFADLLTTVSETYAREIQTGEYGAGLDGVLRGRSGDLFGVLNGVDYAQWDPHRDPHIPKPYGPDDLAGKAVCKLVLQREMGLPEDAGVPLVGAVGRLADQKGFDLIAAAIDQVLGRGVQFVLLGTGDPRYHRLFEEIARRYPQQVAVRLGFDNPLAHRIEAGADCFLMPSRYEPSGLNQLYSLRYGTVPIVRRTGGLADSIVDADPAAIERGAATGFVFAAYEPAALLGAIERALAAYRQPAMWREIQLAGMRADFSWERSARRYIELYELARSRRTPGRATPPGWRRE